MINLHDKKFVFFDMDGILIDTEGLYYSARKEILAKYGFPFSKEDNQHYIAKGFPDTKRRLQELTGDPKLGSKIFEESMERYHEKVLAGEVTLKSGVIELLTYLQNHNIARYITSSATKEILTLNAKNAGITDYFTNLISGDDVKNNKPAPDIYLHALDVTHAKTEEAVVFEDSNSGIESGLSAKIDVIIVPDLVQPKPELAKQAVAVLPNLKESIKLFE
ncbi:HAD family hydrolase [Companilactobacillus huachuanensis]|uniref:HAD family hydrolase n=1 Tax=Companilactobacillus huachuanensis TaxID=2559914 RepID=A0ABW1RP33_9LACO|nr:HAD family phosphatase [Companilactobacillus huachuanensis]